MNQGVIQLSNEQVDNSKEILIGERIEDDHFVQAVEELRIERALHLVHHQFFHGALTGFVGAGLETDGSTPLQMAGSQVGSHDDDGIAEIDGVTKAVGELAVFEDLQQYIEDVRMSFFNFIQEDDGVGSAANTLGELAAFFVADIAWRGANQFGDGVLLHEFGHIEAHQRLSRAEKEFGETASYFRFADARGPEEKEATDGAQRRFQTGAAAADGASQRGDGFVLTDDALVKLGLDAQKFLLFVFLNRGDADASPARNDFFDIFAG